MKKLLTLTPLSVLALLSLAPLQAQDTIPPVLTSINVSPGTVDVTSGSTNVDVTVTVTDNDSGFSFGNLFLRNPSGAFVSSTHFTTTQRTSGDNLDGTYEISLSVPQYAPPGTWTVGVRLVDNENREREYGPSKEPFPVPGDEDLIVTNSGPADTAAPQLVSLSVTPATIDTGTVARDLTVTLNLTDDLSGLKFASLGVYNPSGNQTNIFGFLSPPDLISGDALNGTYQDTISIPPGSAEGTWTITVYLSDEVGNTTSLGSPAGAAFEVDNTGGALQGDLSDATDATQFMWTTQGNADWFIQNVTTFDGIDAAQSGSIPDNDCSEMEVDVTGPGTLDFKWKVESEEDADYLRVYLDDSFEDEISGDIDWTSGSLSIPPGSHTIRWSYEKDGGNSVGQDAGWVDRVKFLADSDTELPVLQYVKISPNPVDISAGDVEVTVTLELTDDFDGVDGGYVCIYDENDEYYTDDSFYLVEGDANCGTYEMTFTVYQSDFSEGSPYQLGTWRVDVEIDESGPSFGSIYYGPFSGNDFPIPGAQHFTVGDGVGGVDTSAPMLVSINSFAPHPVDLTSGSQSVTVNFDLSDNSSGFDYGVLYLFNANGGFVTSEFFDTNQELSSSGPLSGNYEVAFVVPAYGPPGSWAIGFDLYDFAENQRSYPFDTSFPNPGDELFTVTNTGPVDSQEPVLNALTISPRTIDTSTTSRTIDITLDVTDDLSGLRSAFLYIYDSNNVFIRSLFKSIAGGGATSGPFIGSIEVPQGTTEDTYRVSVVLRDMVGNSVRYGLNGTLPMPNPGDEEFVVGPLGPSSTYDSFTASYSLTGTDALPGSNPDHDPFSNVLELILGLNPTLPDPVDPALYETSMSGGALHLDFTIDPALTVQINGDYLEISDGSGAPLTVTGQTGANLIDDWIRQLPVNTSGTTYRISLPFPVGTRGFLRLEFTVP